MYHVSGFPEPFANGTKVKYRRWAKTYHNQIIRDDIRNEFAVRDIDKMETLYQMLSNHIGSPFSAMKFARALKVSHNTISSWISVFERFFLLLRIRPYSNRIKRSLLRDPKLYFYDYCRISDDAFRFENMVAVELSRATTLWNDIGFGEYELWYLRNKEKEEVDFLVTDNSKPLFMVEAESSKTEITPALLKFQNALNIPAIQLVNKPDIARKITNGANEILVVSAAAWLSGLN
jgi:predicted AAA+ superfamily ATPase